MSRHLNPRAALGDDLMRVIHAQTAKAAREATGPGTGAERVHDARIACKRIRAALRLIRRRAPAVYRRENAWFRDSARKFSAVRGADVLANTFAALLEHRSGKVGRVRVQVIRRRLAAFRRQTWPDATALEVALERFARRMRTASVRLAKVRIKGEGFATIASGFASTYRRARRAFHDADLEKGGPDVHRWRKEAKAHGEHLRLLQAAWPRVLKKVRREISTLTEILGEQHDLDGLQDFLVADENPAAKAGTADPLVAFIASQRRKLGRAALLPGRRVFADEPRVLRKRMARWWSAAARRRSGRGKSRPR
jgi:CHAD domain-containing protein